MNQPEVVQVLRSLSEGVDPQTGEVFPPERPYQRPQIIRALGWMREAVEFA